jgi:hypothetical protein
VAGAAVAAFTAATRDPDGPLSVGLVVGGAAIACGALAAALLVGLGTRARRGKPRDAAAARALRRGVMVGSVVGLVGLLRIVDGLTPLTAVFVVGPFIVAEAVLSVRRA